MRHLPAVHGSGLRLRRRKAPAARKVRRLDKEPHTQPAKRLTHTKPLQRYLKDECGV